MISTLIGSAANAAIQAAACAGIPSRLGPFVTVPHVVWRAEEKHEIGAATGAVGLDMESFEVGRAAQGRNVPFLVVRAISDLRDILLRRLIPRCLSLGNTLGFHRVDQRQRE